MAAFIRKQYAGAAVPTTTSTLLTVGGTSVDILATTGWPSLSGVPFYVVIGTGSAYEEKCLATISGNTLTLTRAQDDTTAYEHAIGSQVYPVFTANDADEANELVTKLTTKGDLLVTDGNGLFRLDIGENGYFLKANNSASFGVEWGSIPTINSLDDVGDVTITTIEDGDFLKYSTSASAWINETVHFLTVSDTAPNDEVKEGDLWYNSSELELYAYYSNSWIQLTLTPEFLKVEELDNVYIDNPNAGDVLTFDGLDWYNDNVVSLLGQDISADTVTASVFTGNLTGNSDTATALETPRTISLSGDVSGSVSFDGSQDVSISATVQINSITLGTDTSGNYMSDLTQGTGVTITHTPGEGSNATIAIGQAVGTSSSVQFAAITAPLIGNASTATTLQTARNIAGQSFNGSSDISIAPTDLTGVTSTAAELNILDGATLSTVELNYVDGVTSAIQTQLNDKAPLASPTFTGTVSGITKTMVGLSNVDNTADSAKPVSTAQQTALDLKANLASPALTGTPTAPTAAASTNTTQVATTAFVRAEVAALVGTAGATLDTLGELATALGNDANLSTTLTTSIGLKAPLASPTFTGTVSGITKTMVGLGSVDNTADTAKPVSTAQQTALDLKANLASPTFTGTVTLPDNTVALGVKTTGDYVSSLVQGTGVTITNNTGENSTPTIAIGQAVATSSSVQFAAVTAPVIGNASTATTLQTARTITLGGDLSGSVSFNGSSNVTLTATVAADSVALGTDTTGNYMANVSASTGISISHTQGEGSTATISTTGVQTLGAKAGNYTLAAGDAAETIIIMDSSSANDLTVPPASSVAFGTGTSITVIQRGTGKTRILAGAGVTLLATPGVYLRARYSSCTIVKTENANEWFVIGDLAAS
jgi:hypothetical protein